MSAVLHSWLGFIALAAALLHFALVAGSPLPVALVLLLVGVAEFVWGVFTFVRPRPPVPMLARSGALMPVIGWTLLLVVAGANSFGSLTRPGELFPMLLASFFDLLIAAGLTVSLRRMDAAPAPAQTAASANPARYLVGVLGGALVIAALTTTALAATEAGQTGQPHGKTPSTTYDFGGGHDH